VAVVGPAVTRMDSPYCESNTEVVERGERERERDELLNRVGTRRVHLKGVRCCFEKV